MTYLGSILTHLKHTAHLYRRRRGCIGARLFIIAAPGMIYFLLGPGPAAIWMVDA